MCACLTGRRFAPGRFFPPVHARILIEDAAEVTSLGVDEDLWLKVKIDGDTGWIHTAEDFSALGLQQSG